MGRLFWKFFAFIWLAQLAGIIAIASTFWLSPLGRMDDRRGPEARSYPPAPPGDAHFLRPAEPPGPPPPNAPPPPRPRSLPPVRPTIATLLASLLTAALLAWYFAKPIGSLRHAFAEASAGRLDYRVGALMSKRRDELADLGQEFDRMAQRLQGAMERQRRLLHDVSHEVRSPLARLQAAVGLLRQKPDSQISAIDRIEEEITRIDRLIAELLKLSRLEAGEVSEEVQEIDLSDLVSQVVEDANFEAEAAGRAVSWIDRTPATLRGRPELLHVAFENILRNALKHAPQSHTIEVQTHLDAAGLRYLFRVLDTGPGVLSEDLPRLFTPFFRSSSALSTEGSGLGLAIARRSIEAHGGSVCARNRPSGGLIVEATLPLDGGRGAAG